MHLCLIQKTLKIPPENENTDTELDTRKQRAREEFEKLEEAAQTDVENHA